MIRLDGIRGIAVLFVFLSHCNVLDAGWLGVQLFFVLSGYLITGILRRDGEEKYFWTPFYARRVTRILPALPWAFLAASLTCGLGVLQHLPSFLLLNGNWIAAFHSKDCDGLSPLWSLAVEEQFYLIWPFAVRYIKRSNLIRILATVIVASPFLRFALTHRFHTWRPIHFLTPFQLDAICAGCLLALLLESKTPEAQLKKWSGYSLCFVLSVLLLFTFIPKYHFHFTANNRAFNSLGYSLGCAISASAVSYVILRPKSWLSIVLSHRSLVLMGAISYSFYLVHYPLLIAFHAFFSGMHSPLRWKEAVFAFLAAVIFSWLSFRFYESRCIRIGHQWASRIRSRQPEVMGT